MALYINISEHCSRFELEPHEKIGIIQKLLSKFKNLEKLDFGRGMHFGGVFFSPILISNGS